MPKDTQKLREIISHLFQDVVIDGVAKESGQRVVYYCHFSGRGLASDDELGWSSFGSVVMKVCEGIDAATIAYMQMEIDVLNNLDSIYFPKLLWSDVLTDDPITDERLTDRLFISIEEYIESTPLSQCSSLFNTEKSVIKLLLSIVEGASKLWLHEKKLVHRDLKPDNILIRPNGEPVIIDLGILRETGAKGVTQTQFFGPMTLLYASPEQVNYDKKAISYKTDFFSLGTIVYELLTGHNPYVTSQANSASAVANNIATLTPPTLNELGVTSIKFSQIVQRMIEKHPYKRYRTVDLLRSDLITTFEN